MTDKWLRQALIIMEIRMLRAEHALKQAGIPRPPRPAADELVQLWDSELICPTCGAELPMPIGGEVGWFCVECGNGWAKAWKGAAGSPAT